jgi:hypothetical protein
VTLRTRRLLLRPLTEGDEDVLEALYRDTEVARFIGGNALDARAQLEHFAQIWRTCGFGQSAAIDWACTSTAKIERRAASTSTCSARTLTPTAIAP